MKSRHCLAILAAASLPFAAVKGEDGQAQTVEQKQMQGCAMMDKTPMASDWKEQDAELDKLVAEMNSAPSDQKLAAVAAVLTKLVEQRKAMRERAEMMCASHKGGMDMCKMMCGESGQGGEEHSHAH